MRGTERLEWGDENGQRRRSALSPDTRSWRAALAKRRRCVPARLLIAQLFPAQGNDAVPLMLAHVDAATLVPLRWPNATRVCRRSVPVCRMWRKRRLTGDRLWRYRDAYSSTSGGRAEQRTMAAALTAAIACRCGDHEATPLKFAQRRTTAAWRGVENTALVYMSSRLVSVPSAGNAADCRFLRHWAIVVSRPVLIAVPGRQPKIFFPRQYRAQLIWLNYTRTLLQPPLEEWHSRKTPH